MISWCVRQERGLRVAPVNRALSLAYLRKAKGLLRMADAALESKNPYWIATTSYYARYFAVLALLRRVGVKTEIQDCAISMFRFLARMGMAPRGLGVEILQCKQFRFNTQCYALKDFDMKIAEGTVEASHRFISEVEGSLRKITAAQVREVRAELQRQIKRGEMFQRLQSLNRGE